MKAVCSWGDGPDVTLALKGSTLVLGKNPKEKNKWKHGTVSQGWYY